MSEQIDIKTAIEDFGKTFEEFKKVNDERLDKIEEGQGSAYDEGKLAKIEEKRDSLEDINQKITLSEQGAENIKEQMDKLETLLKRPSSGLESKQIDEKMEAFDSYLRKGKDAISEIEKKALTVSNDSTGGYLAPPEYVRELLKTVTEISPIRSLARVRNTAQRSIQVPKRTSTFAAQRV